MTQGSKQKKMETLCIYFVFSFFSLTFGSPHVAQYEIKDGKKKDNSFDDMLHRLHNFGTIEKLLNDKKGFGSKLTKFSWDDCGSSGDLVQIKGLALTPSPLHFPGPLNVAAKFNIKKDLSEPISASLVIKKEVLGTYIEIPCIDNFGSCKYPDVCTYLTNIASQCPAPLKDIGINCLCPLKAKSYSLKTTEFDINASVIPTGSYEIHAQLYQGSAEAACLDIKFEIE